MKLAQELKRLILHAQYPVESKYINEISLSRVYTFFQQSGEKSFAILTAFRHEFDLAKNRERNKALEQDFRSAKLGFSKITGVWQECTLKDEKGDTVAYDKCPEDKLLKSKEESFVVYGMDFETAKKLCAKYPPIQDGFTYFGSDVPDKKFKGGIFNCRGEYIITKDGPLKFNKFSPNKIAEGYSSIKRARESNASQRHFLFESYFFNYQPGSYIDSCTYHNQRAKY